VEKKRGKERRGEERKERRGDERRSAYRALVGKPEGMRPLRRPRSRRED
jgi:hypothetical protein